MATKIVLASDTTALASDLRRAEPTLTAFLGSQELARRAWRVAYVLVRRTPDLQKCSLPSILDGVLQAAQFGLELGTEAYLVPFRSKVTGTHEAVFIPDWKGLLRLAIGVGSLTGGHGDLVYADDEYVNRRIGDTVEFTHSRKRFGARAKVDSVEEHVKASCQGVYFIGYRPSGPPVVEELSVDEVEYVRKTYSRASGGDLWTKRWSAAAIKTVCKQALKLVRMTPVLQRAIELDNRFETGIQTAVLDEDEELFRPYAEPRPRSAGRADGAAPPSGGEPPRAPDTSPDTAAGTAPGPSAPAPHAEKPDVSELYARYTDALKRNEVGADAARAWARSKGFPGGLDHWTAQQFNEAIQELETTKGVSFEEAHIRHLADVAEVDADERAQIEQALKDARGLKAKGRTIREAVRNRLAPRAAEREQQQEPTLPLESGTP